MEEFIKCAWNLSAYNQRIATRIPGGYYACLQYPEIQCRGYAIALSYESATIYYKHKKVKYIDHKDEIDDIIALVMSIISERIEVMHNNMYHEWFMNN